MNAIWTTTSRIRSPTLLALVLCAVCAFADAAPVGCDPRQQADIARGRAALRAMDCARCHGRDYAGWAAPSLIVAVRDGTYARFVHFVLHGDPTRGMPSYRSQPLVVTELDAMYAYLICLSEVSAATAASSARR
jgi:mono/diheme cytochrome c family protein